jgi:hypothetical protein
MASEEIVESVSTDENSAVQPENTPVEQVETAETSTSVENNNVAPQQENVTDKGTVTEQKPQYTDLEKAQYSFHKQFSKQKAKYEKQLAERDSQMKELMARLDKLENPAKYAPKTRDQFDNDDDFINDLVDTKVQAILAKRLEEYQKQDEEKQRQNEIETQYKNRVNDAVSKLYPDDASRAKYQETIDSALQDGLGDVLEQDEDLCKYIMLSPVGPKIMFELASNIDSVDSLFGEGTTPISRQFKIREIEAKLMASPAPTAVPNNQTPAVEQPKPKEVKVVGQPGKQVGTATKDDIFSNDEALIEFLRK